MGYKIEYLKWFECYGQAMQLIGTLYSDLNSMVEIEQAICNSSAIQSESVDALKSYIKDVQWGSFLNNIMNMCSEANRIMSLYITGLQNFDASVDAVIDEEYLIGLEEKLKTLDIELSDFTDSMEAKAKSVSHIVSLPSKTSENISTGIEAMAKEVARVRHDFTDYEERKAQEFESFNELMNEFVRAGLYHVEAMPDVLNYSRTNAMIDPLKDMPEHYRRYREEVNYSDEQAAKDIQAMQDLMVVYENYRKSEEQMKYALETVVVMASLLMPFGSGYGVLFFTLSRMTSAASIYYNLDKTLEAYDAGVLADTRNVEREAQGLTNFAEGSQTEAIYSIAGNLTTFYTSSVVADYAMKQMFSLADYDIELIPKETAVPEAEFTKFKLETPKSNNVDVLEVPKGSGGQPIKDVRNLELKVVGTYDNNCYFTRSVEFNAGSNGTGFTYKIYQRNDIDWNMVRKTGAKKGRGLTNAQAAEKYGLAPILNDGYVATLHHSQQKSIGPLFETSTRYHNILNAKKGPLHPYKGQLNPFNPMDSATRGLFQKVDSIEYWKARGRDAMKGVQ